MPLQNPISCNISRSYSVRIRSRCASRSLFCDSSCDDALLEFLADGSQGAIEFVRRSHELFRRVKRDHAERFVGVPGEGIEPGDERRSRRRKTRSESLLRRPSPDRLRPRRRARGICRARNSCRCARTTCRSSGRAPPRGRCAGRVSP